jgi:hypothetical protein
MTFSEQIGKLKENWLLVLLLLAVVVVAFRPSISTFTGGMAYDNSYAEEAMYKSAGYAGGSRNYYPPIYDNRDFAPDETERKIMKTVTMSTELERGTFSDEEMKLKGIVSSTGSYLLDENQNRYGEQWRSYRSGSYTIKIPAPKVDAVLTQLKAIGEIQSYNENKDDITGQYKNLKLELETEKLRLARYQDMFDEATLVADKITLNDRMFDQERTIKYMEEQLKNMDATVEYSTVYFSMHEKQSEYVNVVFVRFSELVRMLVSSVNSLVSLLFVALPWAVAVWLISLVVKIFKGRKRR